MTPAQTRYLADTLVRAFAAVDEILQRHYESGHYATPDLISHWLVEEVARRLSLFVLAFDDDVDLAAGLLDEAVENLGRGETLDPWDVLAFRAPVDFRSHRIVLSDRPELSPEVRAAEAELLRRRIAVLEEDEYCGARTITVTGPDADEARAEVESRVPGVEYVDWAGENPLSIGPVRCTDYRLKEPDHLRVWVLVPPGGHVEELHAAESEEEVVLLALACMPAHGGEGVPRGEPCRIHLRAPLGQRRVVCAASGAEVPPA